MVQLIVLLTLSVVTARLLNQKYKVASIAHSILFIFLLTIFFFTTDIWFIRDYMMNWMGPANYTLLYDAIATPCLILNFGISGFLVYEIAIVIILPLLSVVTLFKEVREKFKTLKIRRRIHILIERIIKLVFSPIKDFKHTQNEIYLVLSRLLN